MQLNFSLKECESPSGSIVFLHGFLEDLSMWDMLSKRFTQLGFRTLCVDLPCHGQSRFTGDYCTMEIMAAEVVKLLDSADFKTPWVIGHSMGGYVGLEMLKIRSLNLILLNSNFWSDSPQKKTDRNRIIQVVKKARETFIQEAIPHLFYSANKIRCTAAIKHLVSEAKKNPASEIIACTAGLRDRRAQFELFDHSTIHLIHGENDPLLPNEVLAEELGKIDQNAVVSRIPDCGHMAVWEQPEKLEVILTTIIRP